MQVKTKNLLVAALAGVLVLLLWYRVVYSPMQATASKANTAAEEAESRAETLEAQIAGEEESKAKAPEIAEKKLQSAIPVDDEVTDFLRETDRIFAASGAGFQSVTPSEPSLEGNVSTINVGITVRGSYAQISGYLSELLNLDRIFVVDNVSMTAGGGSSAGEASGGGPVGEVFAGVGSAPDLQVQISGRMFQQPDVVGVPAAGTPAGAGTQTAPAPGATPTGGIQNN